MEKKINESIDKRTIQTDALATLGTKIDENQGRDAIHLAVENVVAGQMLGPGDDIGFLDDGRVGYVNNPVGIVDPFLKDMIQENERFWLIVYPRTITSLRHVWSHPSIPDKIQSKAESEQWIKDFLDNGIKTDYDVVMSAIKAHFGPWGDISSDSICLSEDIDGDREIPPEFWVHFQIVTGIDTSKVPTKPTYFRCAC